MKKTVLTALLILIAVILISGYPIKEKVQAVFKQNIGFDDLAKTIEVSIAQNPYAAPVFNMKPETDGAVLCDSDVCVADSGDSE